MPRELTDERLVLDECQESIGYRFARVELLRAALTHTSGANTRAGSNERLEFLGDSVLGLVTCAALYERFPDYQEGDLTKIKSVVVSRRTCAAFSQEVGLGDYLFTGKGMPAGAQVPMNMLADVFEALVAAIFLDGGYDAADEFVRDFIEPEIDKVAKEAVSLNAKSRLQTHAQREFGDTPRYVVLDEQGPDHDRCFKVSVEIAGRYYPPVWGRTKKQAELMAATSALAALRGEVAPGAE